MASKGRQPEYDETDEEVKKLQMIEVNKHNKFDTVCAFVVYDGLVFG